ncbi:MAG: cobalamin-dependent protein, partial [Bdellovibrionales bacterium]|nr:cobalamin-dependent protein [Bdellovibrionales bacterium]
MSYTAKNPIRIITAASLFDGHDASINIMRRILQDFGAEIIHLGHNRSVQDVVTAALQEGAQSICISSYQGGHMEYFKYMRDLLDANGAGYVKIYGGGGGVIVFDEKRELEAYGISQIFHPEDGRKLGLEGMIQMVIEGSDYNLLDAAKQSEVKKSKYTDEWLQQCRELGLILTALELNADYKLAAKAVSASHTATTLGITGTGGAGKSSLIDELLHRYKNAFANKTAAVVCVDPTKKKTGGALLGDRIRMNSLSRPGLFMRSLASRGSGSEVADALPKVLNLLKEKGFEFLIAETSGIGQAASRITEVSDISMYVMTSEFGAQSQLEKIDMIDYADFIVINKADRRGSQDALHDVKKQYKRSRKQFTVNDSDLPVYLCQASQFNDGGVNQLFLSLASKLAESEKSFSVSKEFLDNLKETTKQTIIPPDRAPYLMDIAKTLRTYKKE